MKPSLGIGLTAAVALAIAGCSSSTKTGSTNEGHSGSAASITIAVDADPGSLNPITNATTASEQIDAFMYESLLDLRQGERPIGALAQNWKTTATSAKFTLKPGIKCVNGENLTATDVAATFAYAEKGSTGSPYKGVAFPATGLKISAENATRTVTFTTTTPESFLAETLGSLPIVCGAGLKNPKQLGTADSGTGAYALTSSTPGESYTFKLRSDYTWGPGGVSSSTSGLPKTVVTKVVPSVSTRANLLLAGGVQIAAVSGTDQARLTSTNFATRAQVDLSPGMVFFNQNSARAGHDLKVRQAVAAALDRDTLGEVSSDKQGSALTNLVPDYNSLCPGASSASSIPSQDISRATSLLGQDGWKLGSGGMRYKDGKELTLQLLYPSNLSPAVTSAMELMQQQLAKVGIQGVLKPSSSYTNVLFEGGNWDLAWTSIYTTLPSDWLGILSGEFPPKGGNWTYNTNTEYFRLAAKAQNYADIASCKYWTAAQSSLFTNLEVLPIYSIPTTTYGDGVQFGLTNGLVSPTTMRTGS